MLSPKKLNCIPQRDGFFSSHLCSAVGEPFLNSDVQVESAGSFHMYKSTFVGPPAPSWVGAVDVFIVFTESLFSKMVLDAPFCGD